MKNWRYNLLLLLILFTTVGCQMKQGSQSETENVYRIYYLNSSMVRLAPWEYKTETTDRETLIQELLHQFLNVPNDVDSQAALSEKVGYLGYQQEDKVLYLYFDNILCIPLGIALHGIHKSLHIFHGHPRIHAIHHT